MNDNSRHGNEAKGKVCHIEERRTLGGWDEIILLIEIQRGISERGRKDERMDVHWESKDGFGIRKRENRTCQARSMVVREGIETESWTNCQVVCILRGPYVEAEGTYQKPMNIPFHLFSRLALGQYLRCCNQESCC
jgi:hypothetical protein